MTKQIQRIERAAAKAEAARSALQAAICEAHAEGLALRKIADAAGMSHESVRRIVAAG